MTYGLHPLLSPVRPIWARAAGQAALLSIFVMLSACGQSGGETYQGYGEGEYVTIAPNESGPLDHLNVERGMIVEKGAELFRLEATTQQAARDEAAANLDRARAALEDVSKGLRPSEIDALEASLASARAQVRLTTLDYERKNKLFAKGNVSQATLDQSRETLSQAKSTVRQLAAQLETGKSPARSDQVAQARANIAAAEAALARADYALARRIGRAPARALVNDTYYKPGEVIGAGQPVVSLLPPENIKIRFFIPETALGAIRVGQKLQLSCDGCSGDLTAQVSYISPQSEFTPPVIYSEQSRTKLVYMIEARPDHDPEKIHPGQPITVTLIPQPAKSGE